MKIRTGLFILISWFPAAATAQPSETVPVVDLNRYGGLWYEIASFPAVFQKGCNCTTAEYEVIPGKHFIYVTNRCIKFKNGNSKLSKARAKAFPVPGSGNAKLRVQFFWPFRGDYYIIGLAPDYSWALVGHPEKKYLWILSRDSFMPSHTYNDILKLIKDKGYDTGRLIKTPRNCDNVE